MSADRSTYLGGPDVAAIVGAHPWRSAYQVWAEKTGRVQRPDLSDDERVLWGVLLEPVIAEELGRRIGATLTPGAFVAHPTAPFLAGHPDYFASLDGGTAVVEIKTTGAWFERDWAEGAPLLPRVQATYYAALSGATHILPAGLIGGQKLRWVIEPVKHLLASRLLDTAAEWWQRHVVADTPPDVDGSDSTRETLRALWPADDGESVALPADAMEWDGELVALKGQRKSIEERIAHYEARLIDALGPAAKGVLPDGTFYSYRTQKRDGYTVQPTEFRVLRRGTRK